jgi:peptidoglycan hydrolase CwlO-like protein
MLESATDIHIDTLYTMIEELKLKIQQLEKQIEFQRKDILRLEKEIKYIS